MNDKAFVLWLTGLAASGKTTLARALEAVLFQRKHRCCLLDGERLRQGLNNDLGFSFEDRRENIRRAGEIAKLMVDAGVIVIAAFISPYLQDRYRVRSLFPGGNFYEVFLDCPIEICEKRDPKGLYQRARRGELKEFTGVSAPYERPLLPDLVVPTGELTIQDSVRLLLSFMVERQLVTLSTEEENNIEQLSLKFVSS